ncbi:MAG: ABC transporter ATP-binding protein [Pseudomonadota bacterium]
MGEAPSVDIGIGAVARTAPTRFGALIGNALLQAATAWVLVIQLGHVVTDGVATVSTLVLVIFLVAVSATLRGRERVDAEALGQTYIHSLRRAMFAHVLRIRPRELKRQPRGAYVVRFVGDLNSIRHWVTQGLSTLCSSAVVLVASAVILFGIEPLFSLSVVLLGLGVSVAAWILADPLASTNRQLRRRRGQLARFVSELLHATSAVQIHGQQKRETRRLGLRGERVIVASMNRAIVVGVLRSVTEILGYGLVIGFVVYGGVTDSMAAVVPALVIAAWLLAPTRALGRVFEYWQSARVGQQRINAFLQRPTRAEPTSPLNPRWRKTAVEYQQVQAIGGADTIDARIPTGSVAAITGPNGSGKSSLLEATAGLIEPLNGQIIIGGRAVNQIARRRLSQSVVLATPDVPFLRGSLRRNLSYGGPRMSESEFAHQLKRLRLDHLLVNRVDSPRFLQEAGANLSSGERQRLALGRALWCQPSVLLLDEIDAFLDPVSKSVLMESIRSFEGTVLIATHDEELIALADRSVALGEPVVGPEKRSA